VEYLRVAFWDLLFVIYINDLPDVCNNLHTKLYIYADDTKLYRHIHNSKDQDKLQNDIHRVSDWAIEWHWLLKLNVVECHSRQMSTPCVTHSIILLLIAEVKRNAELDRY